MAKRRISNQKVSQIAQERISRLTALSVDALKSGRKDRAVRYVEIALAICRKSKIKMPGQFRYCKKCRIPLVPGINLQIRLNNDVMTHTCTECGHIKRIPYRKEKRI